VKVLKWFSITLSLVILSCTVKHNESILNLFLEKKITHPDLACITNIVGNSDFYLVADWKSNKVFKFDLQDNFLTAFGKTGEGPGEFGKLTDIWLARDETIYLTDQTKNSVFCYDKNGKFLESFTTEYPNFGIAVDDLGNIFLNTINPAYSLTKINGSGELIGKFEQISENENIMLSILSNVSRLIGSNNEIYKIEYNSPNIYRINGLSIEPVYIDKDIESYKKISFQREDNQAVINRGSIVFNDFIISDNYGFIVGGGGADKSGIDHFLKIISIPSWEQVASLWPTELEYNEEGYTIYKNQEYLYFARVNENEIYKFKINWLLDQS